MIHDFVACDMHVRWVKTMKGEVKTMTLVNCTPHPITVQFPDNSFLTFEPSGIVPRVLTSEKEAEPVNGIPCAIQTQGEVFGLPRPEPGTFFIVSRLVFDASDRADLLVPDTGKGAVRDENGHIVAVTRFIRREV